MDDSDSRVVDISVGPKVERFYLSYRNAEDNIHEVMESMYELEHHIPNAILGESSDVIVEIVSDCQKKTAQVIRAPFADNVRGIITSIRKKLVSKVSRDADSSSQHGQRHLNFLLELLGTWSNMVDNIRSSHWGISGTVFRLIISQLHERVIELALECFLKFREDKQLDGWHVRVMEAASAKGSSASDFSIIALDFLLSQMSAMRDIVQQYYKFLRNSFISISIDNQSSSANFMIPGIVSGEDGSGEISLEAVVNAQMELVVSAQEKNKWRELDAVYIALEFGYLSNSIKEALSEPGLLEVEKGVFVPQAVEDVFFLLQRVVERALATGNEGSAFSVGNYIVELLDPTQESKVYQLLCLRQAYRGCFASQLIQVQVDERQHQLTQDSTHRSPHRSPPVSTSASSNRNSSNNLLSSAPVSTKSDNQNQNQTPNPLSHSSSASLLTGVAVASLSGVAVASFSGVNNWLKGLAEPTQGTPHSSEKNENDRTDGTYGTNKNRNTVSRNTATPPLSGSKGSAQTGTLESLLLSALDLDLADLDKNGGKVPETVPLGLKDVGVHLTTLALAPSAIVMLGHLYNPTLTSSGDNYNNNNNNNNNDNDDNNNSNNNSKHGNSSSGAGGGGGGDGVGKGVKKSPLNLISEELTRCGQRYAALLKTEANALAVGIYQRYISSVLLLSLSKPYEINGEIMDRRTGDFELLRVLRDLIPHTPNSEDTDEIEKSKVKNTSSGGGTTEQKENRGGTGTGAGGERGDRSVDSNTAADDTKNVPKGPIFESETEALTKRMKSVKNLLGNRMSSAARTEVLLQLASLLNINLLQSVMRISFTEWGALLLHQEILSLVRIFDEACDESASWKNTTAAVRNQSTPLVLSAKDAFAPVIWALKILTLDQPVDIRKYVIPLIVTSSDQNENATAGLLTEAKIRKIMGRRTDFSKDAVQNVKIVFK